MFRRRRCCSRSNRRRSARESPPGALVAAVSTLRRERGLTQPALADRISIHVSQLRRYEAGTSQPTLDVLRRLATELAISADVLLFDPEERTIPDDLRHHLEAINQLDPDERNAIRTLVEGTLLRHQARKLATS